jgi:ADP-dependent NAD(P)H-hydrate dehydratase / NAD(P)H-hydrate epimerase
MSDRPLGFGRRETGASATTVEPPIPGAVTLDDAAVSALLPERPKRGHKGAFGKVLIVAGSLDYAGAAYLACRAAGRAGAGLVTLAIPESLQPLFAAKVIEATTMALPEDDVEEVDPEPALARILDHDHDALVVGPGLRPGLNTAELVRKLLAAPDDDTPPPIVLDAEALRSLATMERWWDGERRPAVLTPHVGEFERLRAGSGKAPGEDGDLIDDDAARAAATRDAASTWGHVVVLKGAKTVIAAPDGSVAVAPFENPALASGGTGDVLSGAIGSLLAQGLAPFAAARLGVYLHGLAGETIRERFGDAGLLASDLPEAMAVARKRLSGVAERRTAGGRLGFGLRGAQDAAEDPAAPGAVPVADPAGEPVGAPSDSPGAGSGVGDPI